MVGGLKSASILAFRPNSGYYVYSKDNVLPTTLLLPPGAIFYER